ncbi:MAG: hypothetical protein GX287_04770 [Fusobacteria bacterium]|jgi:hypothetical protein|nr:hypothetical protein [Fusobacteriota bacterium]
MSYTIYDVLEGLTRKSNPNAIYQVILLIVLVLLFILASNYYANRPKLLKRKQDDEVFDYILKLKKIDSVELHLIKTLIKRYDIKDKYNILIMEGKFQKYIDMEIMNIEQSIMPEKEKETMIESYNKLKRKIFDN